MSISVIYDYCSTKAANITINRSAGITHTHTCAASSDRQPKAYIKSRQLNNRHHTTRTYPPRSHTHCMRLFECARVYAHSWTAHSTSIRKSRLPRAVDMIFYVKWVCFIQLQSVSSVVCLLSLSRASATDFSAIEMFEHWRISKCAAVSRWQSPIWFIALLLL